MSDVRKTHDISSSIETILTHSGRRPEEQHGFINTPVTRGSTVVFATLDELQARDKPFLYGRPANPNTRSVSEIVTALEGAAGTVVTPSGLSAVSVALLSCLRAGDELLMTDNTYQPTRNFCDNILARMGISTRYYDPRAGAGIADIISDKTRAIFTESPGSLTFEVQDLPTITKIARQKDIITLCDNSWATPLYYRPIALGVDIVIHAATKMFVGHSDAMLGTISANEKTWPAVKETHYLTGMCASPDDAFLATRGLRTLAIRMKEHEARALELAAWLETQPGVTAVLHPALPSHPDHQLFKRDFSGSGSLFSIIVEPASRTAIAAMVDDLELFGMGYSWGGYESLILPADPASIRTAVPWTEKGNVLRIHTGFEAMDDLKADLSAGLERYRAAN